MCAGGRLKDRPFPPPHKGGDPLNSRGIICGLHCAFHPFFSLPVAVGLSAALSQRHPFLDANHLDETNLKLINFALMTFTLRRVEAKDCGLRL